MGSTGEAAIARFSMEASDIVWRGVTLGGLSGSGGASSVGTQAASAATTVRCMEESLLLIFRIQLVCLTLVDDRKQLVTGSSLLYNFSQCKLSYKRAKIEASLANNQCKEIV